MTFIDTAVKPRLNHLIKLPYKAVRDSIYTLPAIVYGFKAVAYAFLSLGLGREFALDSRNVAERKLNQSQYIISKIYFHTISILYPETMENINQKFKSPIIGSGGFLTFKIRPITLEAINFSGSKNPLHSSITSRFTFGVALVALSVARVADFVIGVVIGAITFLPIVWLPFKKSENVANWMGEFVFEQLQITGILKDIFSIGCRIINPQLCLETKS